MEIGNTPGCRGEKFTGTSSGRRMPLKVPAIEESNDVPINEAGVGTAGDAGPPSSHGKVHESSSVTSGTLVCASWSASCLRFARVYKHSRSFSRQREQEGKNLSQRRFASTQEEQAFCFDRRDILDNNPCRRMNDKVVRFQKAVTEGQRWSCPAEMERSSGDHNLFCHPAPTIKWRPSRHFCA